MRALTTFAFAILVLTSGCMSTTPERSVSTASVTPTPERPCAEHHVDRAWKFHQELNDTDNAIVETLAGFALAPEKTVELRMEMMTEGDPESCKIGRGLYHFMSTVTDLERSMAKLAHCDAGEDRRVKVLRADWKMMTEVGGTGWVMTQKDTELYGDLVSASCD